MRIASIKDKTNEVAGILFDDSILKISELNEQLSKSYEKDLLSIIENEQLDDLILCFEKLQKNGLGPLLSKLIPISDVEFAPLYRNPNKIWGIGLNYKDHASDLAEVSPSDEPASFMKPRTSIIGFGDQIVLPHQSSKTTGEAELGVIFSKRCKNIERVDWLSVVAGFTTVIDMTAEDILRKNPRFLTRAKSFDTFFSFGPIFVTPDEIEDVLKLEVATVINGEIHAKNVVSNMTFTPDYLVSFHSKVMTMEPGDIISTGTPRAVALKQGDVIECHISGFEPLKNPVIDIKLQEEEI